MQEFITLNPAAIENLLDGEMPRYAAISELDDGFRIAPLKIKRGRALEVTAHGFPLPHDISNRKSGETYAVRLDEHGGIIVYHAKQPRKNFQPSAKIILRDLEATKVDQDQRVIKPNRVEVAPEPVNQPASFLIRKAEIDAYTPNIPVSPAKTPDDIMEEMAARLTKDWKPSKAPVETVHFAVAQEETVPMGARREIEKKIHVPVSFDRRRGLGSRTVEVVIKRRRALH